MSDPLRVRSMNKYLKVSYVSEGLCVGPSSKGANFTSSVINTGVEEREKGEFY